MKIHPALLDQFSELDKTRVKSRSKLPKKQHARFSSRMNRHRKISASLRRFGKSYESGKFSASLLGDPDDQDEGDRADSVGPT